MPFDVKDKVCMITGANGGIGRAFGQILLENGAKVSLSDINEIPVGEIFDSKYASHIASFKCDVTDHKSFKDFYEKTQEKFGKIDVIINNAGLGGEFNYELMTKVNVIGVMHGTTLGFEYLTRGGIILNIGSVAGVVCKQSSPAYNATKHAVVAYSRSYGGQDHYDKYGIKVFCLCPHFVKTPLVADYSSWIYGDDEKIRQKYQAAMDKIEWMEPSDIAEFMFTVLTTAEENGSVWRCKKNKPLMRIRAPLMDLYD